MEMETCGFQRINIIQEKLAPFLKSAEELKSGSNNHYEESPIDLKPVANTESISLMTKYLRLIKSGEKTVEGRTATEKYRNIQPGDIVRFESDDDSIFCQILSCSRYDTFQEMVEREGIANCLPGIHDLEEAVQIYRSFPGYLEKESLFGVIAFKIKLCDQ